MRWSDSMSSNAIGCCWAKAAEAAKNRKMLARLMGRASICHPAFLVAAAVVAEPRIGCAAPEDDADVHDAGVDELALADLVGEARARGAERRHVSQAAARQRVRHRSD